MFLVFLLTEDLKYFGIIADRTLEVATVYDKKNLLGLCKCIVHTACFSLQVPILEIIEEQNVAQDFSSSESEFCLLSFRLGRGC